ncbi:MAG: CDP-diacylglycerol--glycerol-3-phosphate 3-phosphatidyltransferase [Clostridiales bacterium]|nr:MAG: CDP-diacylglycerol--glycerol-3-phosphate 3-phosphatidyltransferase [Clostridiales bacterium]
MNWPNRLTVLRVLMIPLFLVVLVFVPYPLGPLIGAAIYAVASATDAIDGHLARKNNQVTDFGKFLDPLADKMLVITALVVLQYLDLIHPIITVIIIARELMVTSIRLIAASSAGKVIAAGWWGKAKTVTQMIATILLMVEPVLLGAAEFSWNLPLLTGATPETTAVFGTLMLYIATILTLISGADYLIRNWKYLDYRK